MAGNEDRKAELIAQLAGARKQIDESGAGVRRGMDISTRLRSSFREHAVVWLGGGLLAGILVTRTLRRPRSIKVSKNTEDALPKAGAAALLVAGTKIAFDILRPVLIK